MIVEILSIILSSVLSLIAVIISIISINKQTKSQNINASIQLFDKRFEIYNFVLDLWYIIGYFEASQDIRKKKKHNYKQIIDFVRNVNLTKDISNKIKLAYQNADRYLRMQSCLFSGKVGNYLQKLLSSFYFYIYGIYHKVSLDKTREELAYKEIFDLYKTEDIDMKELKQYVGLSDIKRLDI